MTACPHCDHEVPDGNYCVRCGADLRMRSKRRPARTRRDFAASPGEHLAIPWVVSTLFPQLPRADLRAFYTALVLGTAAVALLCGFGLFPVAVLAAAVLVPTIVGIYLFAVDVYEDAPARALIPTVVWGLVAGVGISLLARSVTTTGTEGATRSTSDVLVGGVLLPLLTVALALIGPLVLLLLDRRFEDVVDGATFGAASAAALVAAQISTSGVFLLDAGLTPSGETWPWLARVLTIAVAFPVLAMAAIAAASASFWLRLRAPIRDRTKLGPLGHPAVAVPMAALLVVAGSLGQPILPVLAWLAELVVLAAAALVWLRLVLHVGLLEEAAEIEIGPPFRCANCGAQTARHSFCSQCGISLNALPTGRVGDDYVRGSSPTRLRRRRMLIVFTAMFVAFVSLAAAAAAFSRPATAKAACQEGEACAPIPPQAPLVSERAAYRSPALGYRLEYDTERWEQIAESPEGVTLRSRRYSAVLLIDGARASDSTPRDLFDGEVSRLRDLLLGLAADDELAHVVLGPQLAGRHGEAGSYVGVVDTPQGVRDQLQIVLMAAGDRETSLVATIEMETSDGSARTDVLRNADSVLKTLRLEGDPAE